MSAGRAPAEVLVVSRLPLHASNLLRALGAFSAPTWVGKRLAVKMTPLTAPVVVFAELLSLVRARGKGRGSQVVIVHFVSLDAIAAYAFRRITGCRVLLYAIGSDVMGDKGHFESAFLGWALRRADSVLCANRGIAARAREFGGKEVRVLPSPFAEPAPVRPREKAFDVASVGALIPVKNQGMLIESLDHLSAPLSVALVGDGPLRRELEAMSSGSPHRIVFLGRVPHSEVAGILASSKVYVQCSSREGIPLALLEAAWAGLPLVVLREEYVSDLVELYGLRVRIAERSPSALADAIEEELVDYDTASVAGRSNAQAIGEYVRNWPAKAREVVLAHG